MLAINGADAFVIACGGDCAANRASTRAPGNAHSAPEWLARGDGTQAAIGAEQGDHAVGTDVDLLVVVAKEARRHREHQHPANCPSL